VAVDDGGEPTEPIEIPIEEALDLHAFAPQDISSVVVDYVDAACEAGLVEVRVIHGRGKGVQRASVHRVLREHPRVESYWDAAESQLGATVARLRGRGREGTQEGQGLLKGS
jgi:DNA-nicking Smr family endonuclease